MTVALAPGDWVRNTVAPGRYPALAVLALVVRAYRKRRAAQSNSSSRKLFLRFFLCWECERKSPSSFSAVFLSNP
jgi:hypothetical protein